MIKKIINNLKYGRRFIRQDGIWEYIWYLNKKPVYFDTFEKLTNQGHYPSKDLAQLEVSKLLEMSKWSHYFELYSRYLLNVKKQRKTPIKFLEIGVAKGGSLDFFRLLLGKSAVIFGIDTDPNCGYVNPREEVRIGSQIDRDFLGNLIEEMGGEIDIVVDDGSHVNEHVIETFCTLFPKLSEGGVYFIEDVCTSYWPGIYRGGLKRKGTSIEFFKGLIDGVNSTYFQNRNTQVVEINQISAIHFHNNVIVIEKGRIGSPAIWSNF